MRESLETITKPYIYISAEQVPTGQHPSCLYIHPGKAIQTVPPLSAYILFLFLTTRFFTESVKSRICAACLCGPYSPYVSLQPTVPHTQSDTPYFLASSEPALPVLEKLVTAQFLSLACQLTAPGLEGEVGRLVSEVHSP